MDRALLNSRQKPTRLPPEYQEQLAWKCAHQIFEDTVARAPDMLAVRGGGREYTYAQINASAERIARYIVSRGFPIETPIGIFADRSPELFMAFPGALKAGCVYVPLDPTHPLERLKYMLDEMKTPLVITATPTHPFGAVPGTEFVHIQTILETAPAAVKDYPRAVKPNNLAYIIFTSGSTGRPKGVMLEHRGLVNFCYYYKHFHGYQFGERCAEVVRPGFDASMSELAGFFFNGVAACIPGDDAMANPARLVDFIVENKVTRIFSATPLGELLIEEEWPASGVSMIELQMGGEALRKRPGRRHSFAVTNVYGPTENTNISTEYVIVETAEQDQRTIPIGYPVANTEAIILSEDLKPVKSGQEGELFLGGVQLARGYWNRPDLTAEKFIPHPLDPTPGARLYRSGDLARYRDDGAIEWLSRVDFQVKLRGYRIELGEIETVLNARPGVKQAVVIPVMKEGKAESLAAYWVPEPAHKTESETLASELRHQLPENMVPKHFVEMDVLPLSPNGKIDRKILPPIDPKKGERARVRGGVLEYLGRSAAPEGNGATPAVCAPGVANDELERKLAGVWSAVLKHAVGTRENFIDVGGTSLTALRIVSMIRRELSFDIPVTQIFAASTVERLAATLRAPKPDASAPHSNLVQIQAGVPGRAPLFGIHGFGGYVFLFYLLAKYLGPEQPVYALRGNGLEPGEEPDDTFDKMAARYLKEILPVAGGHPVHLAGYSLGGTVAFQAAHQLRAQNRAVGLVGMFDTWGPGYPVRMPFSERMWIHFKTMLLAPWATKKKYIGKRLSNLNERLHFMLGKMYVHPDEPRGADELIPENVFWAHRNANGSFRPVRYDGELTMFRAAVPPSFPGNRFDDPTLGWSPYARSIAQHEIPGDHWSMVTEPNIRQLAQAIQESLVKGGRKA